MMSGSQYARLPATRPTARLWTSQVDALRLKQVMINLVKNAIKFVPSGFVRIGARRTGVEAVELWCEDSGPGIPEGKEQGLFDQYAQLNSHDQGTGIGLALCRLLTEQMGGTIGVDPTYRNDGPQGGRGARFLLTLPLRAADAPAAVPATKAAAAEPCTSSQPPLFCVRGPYRAMVVDDDPAVRFVVRRTLAAAGMPIVDEAAHGEEALRKAAACQYDLIMMDQYMASSGGRMTGAHAVTELRAMGSTALIIGLSANDIELELLGAGADLFIRKPLPLPREMSQLLRERLPIPRTWRALLADDSELVRLVRVRLLSEALPGCVIDEACSGREALALVAKHGPYDLVLLDEQLGDAFTGTFVGRAARAVSASAVLVIGSGECSDGDALTAEQRDAGFDLAWPKLSTAAMMRDDVLRCLRAGLKATHCAPAAASGGAAASAPTADAPAMAPAVLPGAPQPSGGVVGSGCSANPSSNSAVHGPSGGPPPAAPTLIDHSVLSGLSADDVRRMHALSFDVASPVSLVGTLRRLEAQFHAGKNTSDLRHSLKGTAISTGAVGVARHVDLFRQAPSAEAIAELWRVLEATRCLLQADGSLRAQHSHADS